MGTKRLAWDASHNIDLTHYKAVRRPGMTDVERAIAFAEEHREVHVEWLKHFRQTTPTTDEDWAERRIGGGVGEQEVAIRRYNVILKVLREYQSISV